jgi:cytochrome c biogenesis protein CcmG/thiol:disulfide interchange protein DsbE
MSPRTKTRASRTRPRRRSQPALGARRPWLVLGGVVAVALVALIVAVLAGSDDDNGGDDAGTTGADSGASLGGSATPAVTVTGEALPSLPDGGTDPAVGAPMPTLSGSGLDGAPVTFPAARRPTMVMFVAHWCPHCQAEVPVVQQWVDGGGLPEGVDLVTVSTAADERRPNYPPADWLASEGWTAPVLADDADQSAARAVGLTAYPFFVAVDAEGGVVARASGELTPDQLNQVAAEIAAGGS